MSQQVVRAFARVLFLSFLPLRAISASEPDEIYETRNLLISNSADERKSGLNRLEVLSLDEELSPSLLLELIDSFMATEHPDAAEKFKALEVTKQINEGHPESTQEVRQRIYKNYFASFIDQRRFSFFNQQIYSQFLQAIKDEPKIAVALVQEPKTEKIGTFTLRAVGGIAGLSIFEDLDAVIKTSSRSEDSQRLRDEARLAKFAILNRALTAAATANDLEKFRQLTAQSLKLLGSTQFETKKYDYGKTCQVSARKYILEYLYWDLRIKNKDQVLGENLSDFEELLSTALDSRSDLLDFRLPGVLGSIGNADTLLLLEKAKGRGDKTFNEFIEGMDVRDGTGKKVKSGGAIRRIQERLKAK